jgi:hypothetical protein
MRQALKISELNLLICLELPDEKEILKSAFERCSTCKLTRVGADHVKRFVNQEQMPLTTSEYLRESPHFQQ